jgi:Cu/Ag efflux pump CusA
MAQLGRSVREPAGRKGAIGDRCAACFLLILVLLYGTFGTVRDSLLVFLCVRWRSVAAWRRSGCATCRSAFRGRRFIALSGVAVLNGL